MSETHKQSLSETPKRSAKKKSEKIFDITIHFYQEFLFLLL